MKLNVFLTTAFEIGCRSAGTGLRAPAHAAHSVASNHSLLPTWRFVEIEGDAFLTFVTEACDA
jgi:hypothetical protein